MTDRESRERLIELVEEAKEEYAGDVTDHTETEYIVECLLNNGVIVLPCKVGDKVYQTDGLKVYEGVVKKIVYDAHIISFDETAIGESIFLTKKEAEAKLRRML